MVRLTIEEESISGHGVYRSASKQANRITYYSDLGDAELAIYVDRRVDMGHPAHRRADLGSQRNWVCRIVANPAGCGHRRQSFHLINASHSAVAAR